MQQAVQSDRGQGSLRRRLTDDGAACGHRRRKLLGQHGQREVPGRDQGGHAGGPLIELPLQTARTVRQDRRLAVGEGVGEEGEEAGGILDLGRAFLERLALLEGDDAGQLALARKQSGRGAGQPAAPLGGGDGLLPGGMGDVHDLGDLGLAHARHLGEAGSGCGVDDREGLAPLGAHPPTGRVPGDVLQQR